MIMALCSLLAPYLSMTTALCSLLAPRNKGFAGRVGTPTIKVEHTIE